MIYQIVGLAVKGIELNEQLQNMFNNHLEYYFEGNKKVASLTPPIQEVILERFSNSNPVPTKNVVGILPTTQK